MASTPAEKWKTAIVKHRKKCQDILKASDSIRYVGAINSHGRTLAGIIRTGVRPILTAEHAKNEFFVIRTLLGMRGYASSTIGVMDHMLIQHSKVTILVVQKGSTMYYITINKKEKNMKKAIADIKKAI